MDDQQKRVPLQGDAAAVRRVANALGVGHGAETHFIFGDDRFSPWGNELARATGAAGVGDGPVRVADLRSWIDAVVPKRGLRPEVGDLIVLAWGLLRQRAWYHHGAAIEAPVPGKVLPEMELRLHPMPSQTEWAGATRAAADIFGLALSPYLTPPAMATLSGQVREASRTMGVPAQALVGHLEDAYRRLDIPTDGAGRRTDRLASARAAATLVSTLQHLDGVAMVRRLASASEDGRGAALGAGLARAQEVGAALAHFRWERLEPVRSADDEAAARILTRLRQGLTADEIVTRAAEALQQADDEAYAWAVASRPADPASPVAPETATASPTDAGDVPLDTDGTRPPVMDRHTHRATRAGGEPDERVVERLRDFLRQHAHDEVEVAWRVVE
jgi:hypothetical protein